MKKIVLAGLIALFLFQTTQAQKLNTTADSIGYAIGVFMAETFKSQGITELNADMAKQALESALEGKKLLMDQMSASQFLTNYLKNMKEKEGKAFLAENAKRPEVTTLPSGLQYEVIEAGKGETPQAADKVTVHYRGTLVDGTVFDSSYERGEPATFPVGGVIKGWTEALQLMKPGAKWKLYIPSDLAYGARQLGKIPAYSTLLFEVELLEIQKAGGNPKE